MEQKIWLIFATSAALLTQLDKQSGKNLIKKYDAISRPIKMHTWFLSTNQNAACPYGVHLSLRLNRLFYLYSRYKQI